MSAAPSPNTASAALDDLAALPRGDDLARLVHTVAFAAADERRSSLSDGLAEVVERAGVTPEDADTSFGNVLRALERGGAEAAGSATRTLLAASLARGVALSLPEGPEAEGRVAESLLWLATHTSIDALSALDAALGEKATGLWQAVAQAVRRVDAGTAPLVGRAGALIAAVALRESASGSARAEARLLANEVRDPIVRALLDGSRAQRKEAAAGSVAQDQGEEASPVALGEVVSAPRGAVSLVLLSACGVLPLMHALRLLGRLVLRYRRPAELRVSARGVTFVSRTEILGRTLRQREVHIPVGALARASREVRYPRVALYAGLFALALGSYLGISLAVDGARAGSPELLGLGALLLALGIALDFVLENVASTSSGRCRVVFLPRKGPAVAIGGLDPAAADAALGRLV